MLLDITIGYEELAINRAHLDKIIIHTNQSRASINRQVKDDRDFSFSSRKSFDKMSIYFRRKSNNRIPMNPSRTIGSITLHITSLDSGTGIGWNSDGGRNSGEKSHQETLLASASLK